MIYKSLCQKRESAQRQSKTKSSDVNTSHDITALGKDTSLLIDNVKVTYV